MSTENERPAESAGVEGRLAALERANKRWRLATLGLLGAWAVTLSCSRSDSGGPRVVAAADQAAGNGGGVTRTLRVNEIELVNLQGATVGWINKGGTPAAGMTFGDGSGKPLVLVAPLPSGAGGLAVVDSSGEIGVDLSARPGNGGAVTIRNTFGKAVVMVHADKRNQGAVWIFDANGTLLVESGAMQGGGGGITIRNTFGTPVVEAQANKANEGAVLVNDVNGKIGDALSPRMPR